MCDRLTGEFWPADCDSGRCPVCGINRARVRARLITARSRELPRTRFITFTNVPEQWQQRRAWVRDLARRVRADGARCEWVWTTERGSLTGMWHVHAIQHGDYLPWADLHRLAGDRRTEIKSADAGAGAYISKGASIVAHYISKGARSNLESALALNNGRLHHWSRGFWGMPIREYRASIRNPVPRECVTIFAPELRAELDGAYAE